MSQLFSKISYIVCYRESSTERKNALNFTLKRFRNYFPEVEIIIVEQDSDSKLNLDESLNARHLFIQNSGPFNRSWAFNYAVGNSVKDVFVFADADIFLEREGYIECFNATTEFDAITPNKVEILNISIEEGENDKIHFLNKRELHSFAGGMLIITRDGFNRIGGWDERFEGWGGEDDAMSHLIYNRLKSKTFSLTNYHIDHSHENAAGNNHDLYDSNRALIEEILTRNGAALDRYVIQLRTLGLGNAKKYSITNSSQSLKKHTLVLAITTYNRLDYLKKCIASFLDTRSTEYSWQLIIADDGSIDGTKDYLYELEKDHNAIIIHNNRTNIHHQVNTIIKELSCLSFDLCFKCDDDVEFLQKGWDKLYLDTIERTGYDHLIFYDVNWLPHINLSRPIKFGKLISNCKPENIQGAFYTLTNEVIEQVGYFDEQQFGPSGLGHIDYSLRCCRAGFNVITNPFDVDSSNSYIQLQAAISYSSATSSKSKSKTNSQHILEFKKQLLKMDRVFVPYNSNIKNDFSVKNELGTGVRLSKKRTVDRHRRADSTYYPERGFVGFVGFLLKRIYNLGIDLKLYFIPNGIKTFGRVLNKLSLDLLNIEK